MARIRSMKPEFRTSLTVTSWPRDVRLAFALLWGYLDDEGRGVDEPRLIAADCFPMDDDVTPAVVDGWLDVMAASGTIVRYVVDGRRYLASTGWHEHQKPQHPKASRIPRPPGQPPMSEPTGASPATGNDRSAPPEKPHEDLMRTAGDRHEVLIPEGEGEREQGGGTRGAGNRRNAPPSARAPEPPRRCPRHTDDPNPPNCGACADARHRHDAWRRARGTPTPATPTCPLHPEQLAGAESCPACTAEGMPAPPAFRELVAVAGGA